LDSRPDAPARESHLRQANRNDFHLRWHSAPRSSTIRRRADQASAGNRRGWRTDRRTRRYWPASQRSSWRAKACWSLALKDEGPPVSTPDERRVSMKLRSVSAAAMLFLS